MRNCVDSLLKGGELVEILIVNDGSKDDTAKIADEYAEKYPTIVRAFIRKMEDMEKPLIQESAMQQDFILK
mgnify:CR=1 FL=1